MAANLKALLTLNSTQYNQSLDTASKNTDKFGRKVKQGSGDFANFGKSLLKGAAQFAALSVGIDSARAVFDKFISGCQANTDSYGRMMQTCTTASNEFFYAIGTGDFSTFSAGLAKITQQAHDLYDALDALGNATISLGFLGSQNKTAFDEQMNVARDTTKTMEERKAALAKAKELLKENKGYANNFDEKTWKAISAQIGTGVTGGLGKVSKEEFIDILKLDLGNDAKKSELDKQYKEYQLGLARIESRNTITVKDLDGGPSDKIPDYKAINREAAVLNKSYRKAIIYKQMLSKFSDEQLKNMTEMASKSESTMQDQLSRERSLLKVENALNKVETGGSGGSGRTGGSRVYSSGRAAEAPSPEFSQKWFDEQIARINNEIRVVPVMDKEKLNELQEQLFQLSRTRIKLKFGEVDLTQKIEAPEVRLLELPNAEIKLPTKITPPSTDSSNDAVAKQNELNDALSATSQLMANISTATDSSTASMINWTSQMLSATAQLMTQLRALRKGQEATAMAGAVSGAVQSGPAGWIMAGAALASIIALLASIPKFATGGIVGGNSFTGDKILARLNSGEMVLNGNQQASLYRTINNGIGGQGGEVVFRIAGDTIEGVLRNRNRHKKKLA